MPKNKKNIIPQMFDVKPVDQAGQADMQKILSGRKVVQIKRKILAEKRGSREKEVVSFYDIRRPEITDPEALRFRESLEEENSKTFSARCPVMIDNEDAEVKINIETKVDEPVHYLYPSYWDEALDENTEIQGYFQLEEDKLSEEKQKKSFFWNIFSPLDPLLYKRALTSFAVCSFLVLLLIIFPGFIYRGIKVKETAIKGSQKAYANLMSAKENISRKNFKGASFEFQKAYDQFSEISQDIDSLGNIIVQSSRYVPYLSRLSSGFHLSAAGENISQVGVKMSETMDILNQIKNPLENKKETISFLKIFKDTDDKLKESYRLLVDTEDHLTRVSVDDIPEEYRKQFVELRTKLPEINEYLSSYIADSEIIADILGGNGPRKYLFLFQNNQEMRATGGFIGSYAIIDIFNGRIRNFFVDGIFNPDGQLQERIVPPAPIQKISVNWSLHDSNWFPDFPISAEKASWFYEKTGGPTVDGVITMTPEVLGRFLEITGPIEMPEYGVTVSRDNFIEELQYEVEMDYDKELNQPKKILADLVPKVLDKLFNAKDLGDTARAMNVLVSSLNEKHILIYSRNYEIEKSLSERGWAGEMLQAEKDYLSVVNANINGFKTDGVVDESISHKADIQDDGTIINTVTVKRYHRGGDTAYDWWNRVNADYMRVYVPKGSKLLSVSGQTREINSPPVDYEALGYKKDPQVRMQEDTTFIDEESGTKIYEESGKTVFANWVYVSPKETAEITYTYALPFQLKFYDNTKTFDTYSLLAQKQSGSVGSKFSSEITYPDSYKVIWQHPEGNELKQKNASGEKTSVRLETELSTDKFIGLALEEESSRVVIK